MADFNIVYNIILADKFSRAAKKIKASADVVKKKMVVLRTSLKKAGRSFDAFAKKAAVAGAKLRSFGLRMSLLTTLPILLIGRSMVKAASDAEETVSKFNVVFRDISKQSNIAADNLAKNFGLAGSQARKLLGDTGDLLTGFGFTQKMALSLSDDVNKLAVDLASFTNFSGGAEGASRALTKALLGERDSIKILGISILEEDVKKKVQILRAKGMVFATERQANAFATLRLAQEQSKNAIGDYNRTQDQFANKSRLLSSRILDMKEKFGKVMIPIALKLTNVMIKLTEKFAALSPTTKKWILISAGVVAVLGPLVLIFGTILAMLPLLSAGFGMLAIAVNAAALPVLAVVAAFAAGYWIGKKLAEFLDKFPIIWKAIGLAVGFILNPVKTVIALFEKIKNFNFGDILDKISGFFGGGEMNANMNSVSKSTIDVNVNAPQGAVKSVKAKSTGNVKMNVGQNMVATAG